MTRAAKGETMYSFRREFREVSLEGPGLLSQKMAMPHPTGSYGAGCGGIANELSLLLQRNGNRISTKYPGMDNPHETVTR
jgi:hypothetical protein